MISRTRFDAGSDHQSVRNWVPVPSLCVDGTRTGSDPHVYSQGSEKSLANALFSGTDPEDRGLPPDFEWITMGSRGYVPSKFIKCRWTLTMFRHTFGSHRPSNGLLSCLSESPSEPVSQVSLVAPANIQKETNKRSIAVTNSPSFAAITSGR